MDTICGSRCTTREGNIVEATQPDHGGACRLPTAVSDLAIEEQILLLLLGEKER